MSVITLRAMLALALLAPVAPATAQRIVDDDDWISRCEDYSWRSDRARHCESREYSIRSLSGPLIVDGRENGGITVIGWDRDSVSVIARIQANADHEDDARALAKQVTVSVSSGRISADGPSSRRRQSWAVSYEIRVPRRTDLDLRTHNGGIGVREVSGNIDMEAHNGPITVRSAGGRVRGRTTNGPLRAELSGARWEGAGLDLQTTNGPVVLEIPERYAAELQAGTTNGPMRVDFPITVQGRIGRRIETTLNGGGPLIRAITTNGPLSLRR